MAANAAKKVQSSSVKATLEQQERDAARETAAKAAALVPLAPDARTSVERYLDQVAPASVIGRLIKFDGKAGGYHYADDDKKTALSQDTVYTCLAEMTLIGWVRFFGKGVPPARHMGLLYDNFVMPARDSLPDNDRTQWEIGLDGQPQDPWQHHMYLILQGAAGGFYTFGTNTQTGRRAVGSLLKHYSRMLRLEPGFVPLIQLRVGGFNHRDPRIGWVATPTLAVVGRHRLAIKPGLSPKRPADDATLLGDSLPPDDGAPFNDDIPDYQ
jgi:hypothetical protein